MGKNYTAYVGSYTFHGSSKGISILEVDVENGRFTKRREESVNNSSYLTVSHDNRFLYSVVDEGIAAFKILPDGDLEHINTTSIKGIDVSYHQGDINWEKVKNDGVKFAIIRAGSGTKEDSKFKAL